MVTPATVSEDSPKSKKKKNPQIIPVEKTGACIHFHVKQQMCGSPPDYYGRSGLHASFKTAMRGVLEGEKVLLLAEEPSPVSKIKQAF